MSDIVKQDVLDFASELATGPQLADGAWTSLLAYVNKYDLCDVDDTHIARCLLAAHMVTLIRRGKSAASGPVTAESAGNVRRSYGLVANSSGSGSFNQTRYGQLFHDILVASVFPIGVV